ncbi:hypothetical protein [Mucilaginibacter gilvus]|uniref:Uncharacterized protein n=1 Tax=Mucilaginibacter gilvus TaxID=2305909 RepID=A0A444MR18_9SPHI|nr:hypothetical protein [Mucilaginibacter gilvus]RWY54068.1 hypothetical protein EPL05_08460 [Mucilaginibacter gilvus]
MKRCRLLVFIFLFFNCAAQLFAQPKTKKESDAMAARVRAMTPAQIMKFRDSMMSVVLHKQAKALPNGDQLFIKHHYNTAYTTVTFSYTRRTSQNKGGTAGSGIQRIFGVSPKAAMLYEANGHTMVQCALNPVGANTTVLEQMATKLNDNKKYLAPEKALDAGDAASQLAFSSMTANNNTLSGIATDNGAFSGKGCTTNISTKGVPMAMAFSFSYDPVQNISTVGAGATIMRHTVGRCEDGKSGGTTDDQEGIGMLAGTDPSNAKIVGAAYITSDPNVAYAVVTKTAYGFKVKYTKVHHDRENNADLTETLTATIGDPQQQYEAVIMPMPASKYETWLPKGPGVAGSDDPKGDDSARFYVEVHDKNNPNKLYPGSYTVRYELKDITHYKGYNSNYPVYDGNEKADLKISDSIKNNSPGTFDPAIVTDSIAESREGKGNIAIVRIMCLDYGAWGKLTALVFLDDGSTLTASPYYDKGETFITVPYDRDENKIADAWEKSERIIGKGYGLDWDEDVKPDNGHPGDDIALIDEYRGFLTEDDDFKPLYSRLSPQVKELFTIGLSNMTAYGASYKTAIRVGALGYGKATNITVYHFSNSKYGYHENEIGNSTYGRWVNYNTPLNKHVHGIAIYADDIPGPDGKDNVLATTIPLSGLDHPGNGAFVPGDIREVHLWTNFIVNKQPFKPGEFLPERPQGNDLFAQRMATRIAETNAEFRVHIDANHASPVIAQYYEVNIARIISYTVAHELCHATNIHHHHVADGQTDAMAFFKGDANCLIRYWGDSDYPINCATWRQMYIFGLWNPASMITPGGQLITLCRTGDACFFQMKLKKN